MSSNTLSACHFAPKAPSIMPIRIASSPFSVRDHLTTLGGLLLSTFFSMKPSCSSSLNLVARTFGGMPERVLRRRLNLSLPYTPMSLMTRIAHFFPRTPNDASTGQSAKSTLGFRNRGARLLWVLLKSLSRESSCKLSFCSLSDYKYDTSSPPCERSTLPMIDVFAPSDLFPQGSDGQLGHELTIAVLRAEGVAAPGPFHLNNTAAFVHRMDPRSVRTAASESARAVRVQVITPPGALSREGQKQLTKEITEIVAKLSGDPTQATRTWVILTEAAEGGWGIAGTAFGRQEFADLAAKAAEARRNKSS